MSNSRSLRTVIRESRNRDSQRHRNNEILAARDPLVFYLQIVEPRAGHSYATRADVIPALGTRSFLFLFRVHAVPGRLQQYARSEIITRSPLTVLGWRNCFRRRFNSPRGSPFCVFPRTDTPGVFHPINNDVRRAIDLPINLCLLYVRTFLLEFIRF